VCVFVEKCGLKKEKKRKKSVLKNNFILFVNNQNDLQSLTGDTNNIVMTQE